MSTFNGYVEEFPDIRIDYFRSLPDRRPPLKCFLSHVHSDHLQGLESLKSPFVYCSPATREILLRLEKYPHRMNLAKGILETRKQHYKHLKNILKPLPLNTPSEIELGPGNSIRVTLLDANHCAGAVMFFVQGSGKAILYTGDIRSEPWWVESLYRNPILVPYTHGIRRLDKIYLDTTFAPDRHEIPSFPTKAEGLAELLSKVAEYPKETIFHFHAWTFGYEEVWVALANALKSRIHVDDYKIRVYRSLRLSLNDGPVDGKDGRTSGRATRTHDMYLAPEAAALCGHRCGNNDHPGCLTTEENVRLHSCEVGTDCKALQSPNVIWITPIITHSAEGTDVLEMGAGGGGGDLTQHELEIEDQGMMKEFLDLYFRAMHDNSTKKETERIISDAFLSSAQKISLDSISSAFSDRELPLEDLARLLTNAVRSGTLNKKESYGNPLSNSTKPLQRQIRFPYSRHSSYDELCHLVSVFKPKDIYPCTVDERNWTLEVGVRSLFGHLCSEDVFAHDAAMEALEPERKKMRTLKRPRPANSSQDHPRTLSQASQLSEMELNLPATEPDISISPSRNPSTDTTPHVKRRRTDEGTTKTAKTESPNTVTTALTSTMSYEGRLNGIRHSFEEHLLRPSKKLKPLQHSTSDPTPLRQRSPDSETPSMTVHAMTKTRNHGPSPPLPLKCTRPIPIKSRDKKAPKYSSNVGSLEIPEGTQARPIDLSDISDPEPDSDATTDRESDRPAARVSDMDGADEVEQDQDTQFTLSDSAFESQGRLQAKGNGATRDTRLRNRKEAYLAAKELADAGWENEFVIVSSNAGCDDDENEL